MPDYRHPLLQNRNQLEFQEKLQSHMEAAGMDALIILNPQHVFHATGYLAKAGSLPGLMPGHILVAMVPKTGNVVLFITGLEAEEAKLQTRDVEVVTLPSFYFVDDGTDASRRDRDAGAKPMPAILLALEAAKNQVVDPVVGVETSALPDVLGQLLRQHLKPEQLVDCRSLLTAVRKIKLSWEIDMLRLGAQYWDKVVREIASQLEPGMTLLDLDSRIMRTAWEMDTLNTVTSVVAITGCGPFVGLGGLPRNYIMQEGDTFKLDGGAFHLGYTTDICRVWSVGQADPAKAAAFDVLYEGFERGMETLKPGMRLSDTYNVCRAVVEASDNIPSYPRGHVGHSICVEGVLEDQPAITVDEHSFYEPGMVVSHEMSYAATANTPHPGSYNIEDTFLITEEGHERFSYANDSLEWRGE